MCALNPHKFPYESQIWSISSHQIRTLCLLFDRKKAIFKSTVGRMTFSDTAKK